MKSLKNDIRISVLLARRLGPLACTVGLLISLVAPVTYLIIENRALRNSAEQYAVQLSEHFRSIILENPKLWKYQAQKYLETLHGFTPNKGIVSIHILDASESPITQYEYRCPRNTPVILKKLTQRGSTPIMFNNRSIGEIQVEVAAHSIMVRALIFFLTSLCLGIGISFFVYLFPVSVVEKLEKENLNLTNELKRSHQHLEMRVKERTAELAKANAALQRQILARKKSQKALVEAQNHLEERVSSRTADLTAANQQLRLEIEGRRLAQQALGASKEKLRDLSSKLLIVQEEERKRIALEIHDSLATTLSAIKFSVEKIRRDVHRGVSTDDTLNSLIVTIQLAIDECRRIMSGLHPSSLDELGVVSTLEWFCGDFQERYSHINVQAQISLTEKDIPDAIKVVIFRLTQEAFHNITRHSLATRVDLCLSKVSGDIEFSVADNGQGFDLDPAGLTFRPMGGLGILSMQERTENTGGAFSIETVLGKGTTIFAHWPPAQDIANSEHAA